MFKKKKKNGLAPDYMKHYFTAPASSRVYNTRFNSNGCFAVPKVESQGRRSAYLSTNGIPVQ